MRGLSSYLLRVPGITEIVEDCISELTGSIPESVGGLTELREIYLGTLLLHNDIALFCYVLLPR